MSFRIEDILKKDMANQEKRRNRENYNENKQNSVNSCSILQQTLLNKINPYYSQSNSDYYLTERLYSYINNNEKIPYTDNYADFYIGNPYISLYSRNHLFSHPSYNSVPVLLRMTSKRKGGQVRFTTIQTDTLEKRFNSHKYLSPEDRRILAESLKLSDKQVKTWFQNRRAKWRRFYNGSSSSNNLEKVLEN